MCVCICVSVYLCICVGVCVCVCVVACVCLCVCVCVNVCVCVVYMLLSFHVDIECTNECVMVHIRMSPSHFTSMIVPSRVYAHSYDMGDMTHSYWRHDSSIWDARRICMEHTTHALACGRHDSFQWQT